MAELLISSRRTSEGDLRSLMDRLSVAIPDAEPVDDNARVSWITLSTNMSGSAYETTSEIRLKVRSRPKVPQWASESR